LFSHIIRFSKLADLLNENEMQRSETIPQTDSKNKTTFNAQSNVSATEKSQGNKSAASRKASQA